MTSPRGAAGRMLQWARRRWQGHRHGPRAVVLAYHRVAEVERDPLGLCVRPRHFAEHLQALQAYRRVRLDALPDALDDRTAPREAVCVTLDDGYADNLHAARPLLERFDTPATVFVASGQVDAGREFWWDELDALLLVPPTLPASPLPAALRDLPGMRAAHDRRDRDALFDAAHRRLHDASTAERDDVLAAIRAWVGAAPRVRASHAVLSRDELVRLADAALVEIGAHTVTHPRLDRLPEAAQRDEIVGSRRQLEALLERRVTSFAYPHGAHAARTRALVAEAGFARACTVDEALATRTSEPLAIPRFLIHDVDGDGLARRLRRWFGRPPAPVHRGRPAR